MSSPLPPNPHQSVELELFRKAHEAWSKEGRTDEQKYGAINFLTSRHFNEAIKAYGDTRELEGRKAEAFIADKTIGLYPDHEAMKQATLKRIDDLEKGLYISTTELTNNMEG